ncbi:MAG: acyl-[acyl-carrier-protein] thioesterase [Lachnospiraceae bacterium]|nr:acyl-[acyl-carrier-protein] thioesterase [Lachnospiraceae bacterium]
MYSFSTRVRYSEVDASLRLSYPSILNYFQDCSIFHSEDLDIGLQFLKERHRVWLMNFWQIQIVRFPQLGEVLRVNTWPYDFKNMFGYRNFTLTDQENTVIAAANSVWIYTDTDTGRPTRLTPEEAAHYPIEPAYPMEYTSRKIAVPAEWTPAAPISVTVSHIDSNHHVNNAQYAAMASALLPCSDYRNLRIEYKKAAQLGDTIYPRVSTNDDSCTVVLTAEDGTPYAIAEFKK